MSWERDLKNTFWFFLGVGIFLGVVASVCLYETYKHLAVHFR